MTEQELQAIKERAAHATQGPWKVVKSEESGVQIGTTWEHTQLKGCVPVITTAVGVGGTTIYINHDNAEFIVHARQDVPALIATVEKYRELFEICEKGMFKGNDMLLEEKARTAELKREVESLRRENKELAKVALDDTYSAFVMHREINRLREALEEIESSSAGDFDGVRLTARQALEG